MRNKVIFILVGLGVLLLLGGSGLFMFREHMTLATRQAMIHTKGEGVMPFDLNKTTHIFKKIDAGGIQQVIAKNNKDTQQILLIRTHLQMEAGMFAKGNFQDPARLHGMNMAGLQELEKGASQIKIAYTDLPNGGQIAYTTENKDLVNSIHAWFDAQVSDHGSDAMGM